MNHFPPQPFSLDCPRCGQGRLVLDDSALDKSCQGKHVFLFECDHCKGLSATAMNNIPTQEWHQFISAPVLDQMLANYKAVSGRD
ncbi:MAG: hypothetical protein HN842_00895 [Gammaproteobacteria bacterium]|jgi:hypothetical protein|nr:hypothetical protein [Gammaproteobacteria bacterium]